MSSAAEGLIKEVGCPVCRVDNAKVQRVNPSVRYECPLCGPFFLTEEAFDDYLDGSSPPGKWPMIKRAALSHFLRTRKNVKTVSVGNKQIPALDSETLEGFENNGIVLPLVSEQARNLIRFIGAHQREEGRSLESPPSSLAAVVGSANRESAYELMRGLREKGVLTFSDRRDANGHTSFLQAVLTIDGWEKWEALQQGAAASNHGFIAMQYGDKRLDDFVRDVIQAGVRKSLNLEVYRGDSPGKTKAGLIDNIMREQIEDAAFVLVELSHGNEGAYWEAGMAEGLRKPVIYLCEKVVWEDEDNRPHFDVNHRTTVMWEEDKLDEFVEKLSATIKNSLRIQNA